MSVYVVHKLNPTTFKTTIVAICEDYDEAKAELNNACAEYFEKNESYNVVKESNNRINVYIRKNGWIINGKLLIDILDIAEFDCVEHS